MKGLKILFILAMRYDPEEGGVQRTTFKMSSQFDLDGHSSAILAPEWVDNSYSEHLNFFKLDQSSKLSTAESLRIAIKGFAPDIIINQMPHDVQITSAVGLIKKDYKGLVIACLRNSLFSAINDLESYAINGLKVPSALARNKPVQNLAKTVHYYKHRSVLKKILDFHDRFILLTHANVKELVFFVQDYQSKKVGVIPNSIPNLSPNSSKEKSLLFVGRLDKQQKRADQLVTLWAKIYERMPDWRFDIVGDGPLESQLREEAQRLDLPRIKIHGKQNPSEFYSKSKLLVMTSAFEGFPNVLIEGMSFGLVPVCYDSYGALSEIVNHEGNGILVKDQEKVALQYAIVKLSQSDNLDDLSASALNTASNFTIDKVAEIWYQEFKANMAKENQLKLTEID